MNIVKEDAGEANAKAVILESQLQHANVPYFYTKYEKTAAFLGAEGMDVRKLTD